MPFKLRIPLKLGTQRQPVKASKKDKKQEQEQMQTDTPPPLKSNALVLKNQIDSILLNLAPEIHLLIFKNLDRCSSTCLGLASKKLYQIHFSLHRKVPLYAFCALPPYTNIHRTGNGGFLMDLLSKWMGEDLEIFPVPVFDSKGKWWGGIGVLRMVSKERKEELQLWWKRRGFRYMKAVGSEEWCLERCKGREYAKRAFELGRYEHRGVCFAT